MVIASHITNTAYSTICHEERRLTHTLLCLDYFGTFPCLWGHIAVWPLHECTAFRVAVCSHFFPHQLKTNEWLYLDTRWCLNKSKAAQPTFFKLAIEMKTQNFKIIDDFTSVVSQKHWIYIYIYTGPSGLRSWNKCLLNTELVIPTPFGY